ncbi:MAG: type II secretion system protein GspK [bacterium]
MRAIADITRRVLNATERPAPKPKDKRGIALLMVIVTIALIASTVVEYSYQNRVNLALASNERDQLKSYFLARSAVNLSKLLLSFQFALQSESRETEDDMGQLIGRAMRRSNFQMYQYVDLLLGPFNSGKIESPIGGINLSDTGVEGFGDFTGEMAARVVPEDGRINVNNFAKLQVDEGDLAQFCAMVLDPRYDELFEKKDALGNLMDRAKTLQNIMDFVDPDESGIAIGNDCTIQGNSGDELSDYDRTDQKIRPRNAKLIDVSELYQVQGVSDPFMNEFKDQLTVYPIGKPNLNVAQAPVFYSVLCQNLAIEGQSAAGAGILACATNPTIGGQVLLLALALDGIRAFFENPLSVLLAYVGTTESKLLPSAKKGQPVGFLSVSQFPSYIEDLKQNPQLIAQFLAYSPMYQQIVLSNPAFALDPVNPQIPAWTVDFNRSGLMKSVTTTTPRIYRIFATGKYGSTESTIETVVDFDRTVRRLPSEKALEENESDPEAIKELKAARQEQFKEMPKGRHLFWREY